MDSAFTVTPMSNAIELKPGETYEGDILISNPEDAKADFDYKVEVMPYGVVGTGYNADFTTSSINTQMVNWITIFNPTGTIAPNGKNHVKYTITVPKDAAGGGQYAMLIVGSDFSNNVSGDGLSIRNTYEIASIIYAEIEGEIRHQGSILGNSIPGFLL